MTSMAVIPARLGSTRLPRKVLADIHGKPLIWHVWNQVMQAQQFDGVYIATDAEEVKSVAESFGAQVLMSSPECRSGTERIASLVEVVDADLIINVQGDEPLISPTMLDSLVLAWKTNPSELITPVVQLTSIEDIVNPNLVKVARSLNGEALYFSRSPIPFVRDLPQDRWLEQHQFWGHIGVYGYRQDILRAYSSLPLSQLELAEQLEQLRFLDAGYRFQTVETDYRPVAVDVLDDLLRVQQLLNEIK